MPDQVTELNFIKYSIFAQAIRTQMAYGPIIVIICIYKHYLTFSIKLLEIDSHQLHVTNPKESKIYAKIAALLVRFYIQLVAHFTFEYLAAEGKKKLR